MQGSRFYLPVTQRCYEILGSLIGTGFGVVSSSVGAFISLGRRLSKFAVLRRKGNGQQAKDVR